MQFSIAIMTIREGITPVSMVILKLKRTVVPNTQTILIATINKELRTTFIDLKNKYIIIAAIPILIRINKKSSCFTFFIMMVRIYGIPE
jgi:hypothetical protein